MEQFHDALGMLDLMQQPAFCVQNNAIIKVNPAAAAYLIETGMDVRSLLLTGKEEYADFHGGCLYLTLSIAGHSIGASVSRMQDFDVFTMEQDKPDAHLQAMALAARELREPLSNVMTVADKLFPEVAAENAAAQDHICRINRGLFQMLRIIGNMSDAGRYTIDSGRNLEIRDISAVLDEIFRRATVLADHAGITLEYTGHPESVYTLTDVQKLERAVLNIVSNAIKFTPAGGTVSAKLTRRGMRMYLSVCDNGRGIPENLRGSVFNRYAREAAIEDGRYGLGLGMVLIHSVAALHGGTVLIDHPEDAGTRITLSLAIRQGETVVRSSRFMIDYAGERDHGLIELAEVLPAHLYDPDLVN